MRTKSGATAVQIAEYVQGRQQILQHVGSAHTDAELGVLLEKARHLLEDPAQEALDLGISPEPAVARIQHAAEQHGALLAAPAQSSTERDGAGRVQSTASMVLYDALACAYTSLGFEKLDDAVFRDLVIARIVEPTSKRDAARVLADLGAQPASYATVKRHLRAVLEDDYRATIAAQCFQHAATHGDVSLVLYDVTTLYFEAEKEDDLRKVGFSKERRVDPQIVVGLLVDRRGFPLEIGCFEGNKAETKTILPIIRQFQARHNLADMVVVADAGMLSAENLRELDEAELRFIVGSRQTKAPHDLDSHVHWHGDAFTDGQIIDTITPRHGNSKVNDRALRAEPAWDPKQHPDSWRAVWSYSRKRGVRDHKTLTAQENRARAIIDGDKPVKNTRFVKTTSSGRSLDEKNLERARSVAGLKGYYTNIPADQMPAREVIDSYHDLWRVEQSFRMSKTDLQARPMFHRNRDAIEAHLTLVFAALAVARLIQQRTGLAIGNVVKKLRPLRSATLAINGTTQTFPPHVPDDLTRILDAIRAEELTH